LWLAFAVLQLSELGIVCGIGVALVSLVVGVNRGSSSAAGQKAMAEDEARIQQEMGDNDAESS
jgi:F0F1-type ATP synthase membrane subunit c/vacuolar-type H+-ATPase subunit K